MQKAYPEIKYQMHSGSDYAKRMDEPHERLRAARISAGFSNAPEAADALGVPRPTYFAHENGSRGFKPATAKKYARRFRVTEEWLMFGRGNRPGSNDADADEVRDIFERQDENVRVQILRIIRTFDNSQ